MRHITIKTRRNRRGIILSVELIMVLPILLLVLLAFVEFSLITTAQARIENVAVTASRHQYLPTKSPQQIQHIISQMLGQQFARGAFVEIDTPESAGNVGRIRLIVPMQNVTPDLLWMTGFSVRGRFVTGDAPLIRQSGIVQP